MEIPSCVTLSRWDGWLLRCSLHFLCEDVCLSCISHTLIGQMSSFIQSLSSACCPLTRVVHHCTQWSDRPSIFSLDLPLQSGLSVSFVTWEHDLKQLCPLVIITDRTWNLNDILEFSMIFLISLTSPLSSSFSLYSTAAYSKNHSTQAWGHYVTY